MVSEILGHAKTSTTQNIYSHTTETMQQATVTRIETLMFKKDEYEISVEKTVKNKNKEPT